MRYFSVFTGVAGFEIGINKAYGHVPQPEVQDERPDGGLLSGDRSDTLQGNDLRGHPTCVGFSEIDPHASAVLKYRFPNVKNYGDITKIDWSKVPDFDLPVGGSPCQSFSIAGKRAGFEGASGLFMEYLRCLKEKKPAYFIWENVKGVLSSGKGADFAYILDSFSEAGYSFTWQICNAKFFGVPQNRERVFVVGHLGTEPARKVFFEPEDDRVHPPAAPSEEAVHDVAQAQTARQYASWGGNYAVEEITTGQDQAHRVYDPNGVHRTLAANGGGSRSEDGADS